MQSVSPKPLIRLLLLLLLPLPLRLLLLLLLLLLAFRAPGDPSEDAETEERQLEGQRKVPRLGKGVLNPTTTTTTTTSSSSSSSSSSRIKGLGLEYRF